MVGTEVPDIFAGGPTTVYKFLGGQLDTSCTLKRTAFPNTGFIRDCDPGCGMQEDRDCKTPLFPVQPSPVLSTRPSLASEDGLRICQWIRTRSRHSLLCRPDCARSDVHTSNVLRYGLLNPRDLSLSKAFWDQKTKEAEMNYQYDRIGTWKFASVHVLVNHCRVPTVSDDLESFFHVMLYLAIRFLPHSTHDCLEELLFYYFDDHTDGKRGQTAGSTKYIAMHDGRIDITRFTSTELDENSESIEDFLTFMRPDVDSNPTSEPIEEADQHPINLVMSELLQWLEALYGQDKKVVAKRPHRKKDRRVLGNLSLALPGMESADNTQSIQSQPTASERFVELEEATRLVQLELSQKLESHDAIVELLTQCIWDLG